MSCCVLLLPTDPAPAPLPPPDPTEAGTKPRGAGHARGPEAAAIGGRVGRAAEVAPGIATTAAGDTIIGPRGDTIGRVGATVMIVMAASNSSF